MPPNLTQIVLTQYISVNVCQALPLQSYLKSGPGNGEMTGKIPEWWKNPAVRKEKRPEKIPVWWEIPLREIKKTSSGA